MENLPVRLPSVNIDGHPLPLHIRRQLNARAVCPWCSGSMYLTPSDDRLLCADLIHCAGVTPVDAKLVEACTQLAMAKEVA